MSDTLWPPMPDGSPMRIEVIGGTGKHESGKTIFGLTIAPGVHPAGHPFAGKPRTLYLDLEKSGGTFQGLGAERIDVPRVLMAEQGGRYSELAVFEWFRRLVGQIEPDQYDVIAVDPVTDLESGLVEWVKRHPSEVGLTAGQLAKGGGMLWGAVKSQWKQLLLLLASRCQTFYFTSHLRAVWSGSSPTGKYEPKGKDTLMELASLYLWFEREPDAKGRKPEEPAATVIKSRLTGTRWTGDGRLDIFALLSPRLPTATAMAIRNYIASPPDYAKLKKGELVQVHEPTEDERVAARIRLAEAEAEAHAAAIAEMDRRAECAAETPATVAKQPTAPQPVAEPARPAASDPELDDAPLETDGNFLDRVRKGLAVMQGADDDSRVQWAAQDRAVPVTRDQVRAAKLLVEIIEHGADRLRAALDSLGRRRLSDCNKYEANNLLWAMFQALKEGK